MLVAPAGLAPRATRVAAALGTAAELSTRARRALGYRWADHAAARWAMFGTTVADAGRLSPDDARMLLAASDGARRVAAGIRQALAADLRDDLARARAPLGLDLGRRRRIVPFAGLDALRRLRPDAVVETLAAHRPHPADRGPRRGSPARSSACSTPWADALS